MPRAVHIDAFFRRYFLLSRICRLDSLAFLYFSNSHKQKILLLFLLMPWWTWAKNGKFVSKNSSLINCKSPWNWSNVQTKCWFSFYFWGKKCPSYWTFLNSSIISKSWENSIDYRYYVPQEDKDILLKCNEYVNFRNSL